MVKGGVFASECVREEGVLLENFFSDEESVGEGVWSHEKLKFRGNSVARFENISHCYLQHRVIHVGDVVVLLGESELKLG